MLLAVLLSAGSYIGSILGIISRDVMSFLLIILFITYSIWNSLVLRKYTKATENESTKIENMSHVDEDDSKVKELELKLEKSRKEIAEWAEICEGLKYHLAPEIEKWEMQKKTGKRGSVTDYGVVVFEHRKMGYDKAVQKLKEYNETNGSEKPGAQLKSSLGGIDRAPQSDELEKLIKPLYLSLDSNHDNPIKGAHLALGEIKQYGNLAQPELRKLLSRYCEIREEHTKPEDMEKTAHWDHQRRLIDVINQIDVLVKKRYNELMWEEDQS